MTTDSRAIVPAGQIEAKILLIRGQKVMLDRDLALLYQVKAIALRQAVKRNRNRFPEDFVFQLSSKEAEVLVSHSVIPSRRSFGGALPYVFTEQGVACAARKPADIGKHTLTNTHGGAAARGENPRTLGSMTAVRLGGCAARKAADIGTHDRGTTWRLRGEKIRGHWEA